MQSVTTYLDRLLKKPSSVTVLGSPANRLPTAYSTPWFFFRLKNRQISEAKKDHDSFNFESGLKFNATLVHFFEHLIQPMDHRLDAIGKRFKGSKGLFYDIFGHAWFIKNSISGLKNNESGTIKIVRYRQKNDGKKGDGNHLMAGNRLPMRSGSGPRMNLPSNHFRIRTQNIALFFESGSKLFRIMVPKNVAKGESCI
jgi:hypothetical protein